MCAGDTFRAAAADQLEIWAGRTGADIVRQHEGRTLPPWFMTESRRPRPDMPT